jgi:hypothetical protein
LIWGFIFLNLGLAKKARLFYWENKKPKMKIDEIESKYFWLHSLQLVMFLLVLLYELERLQTVSRKILTGFIIFLFLLVGFQRIRIIQVGGPNSKLDNLPTNLNKNEFSLHYT